jgi:uncharacterized protein involved in outer membrane biogenesis
VKPFYRRTLYALGIFVAIYAAAGFLLAPYLVKRYGPEYVARRLGGRVSFGTVRVNPFLLSLKVRDVHLDAPGGAPMVAAARMSADLQASSLFRRAWTLDTVRLEDVQLHLAVDAKGNLNVGILARRLAPKRGAPDENVAAPRILVRSLVLMNGRITFVDQSLAPPAHATVGPIDLAVTDLAMLPERTGHYTISATLPQGGKLSANGEMSLEPVTLDGRIAVKNLALATAWTFLRHEVRMHEPKGMLTVAARYHFGPQAGSTASAFSFSGVDVQGSGIALAEKASGSTLLALDGLRVEDARIDLARREIDVPKIVVSGGRVTASVDADRHWNWRELAVRRDVASANNEPAGSEQWRTRIDALRLENVALEFWDHSRTPPIALDVAAANAALGLDVTAGGGPASVSASGVEITLHDVELATSASAAPVARVDSLQITGGSLDTAAPRIAAKSITLRGGEATLARGSEDRITLVDVLSPPAPGALVRTAAEIEQETEAAGHPWRYALGKLSLEHFEVALSDAAFDPPLAYTMNVPSATLENVARDAGTDMKLAARLVPADGGELTVRGTAAQNFSNAAASVDAQAIPLKPLQRVISHYAALELASGSGSGTAQVKYEASDPAKLRVDAALNLDKVLVREDSSGKRLVSWKTLAVDGIRYRLSHNRLAIRKVSFEEPEGRLVIAKDHTPNFLRDLGPQSGSGDPGRSADGKALAFRVDRIDFRGGTLDFADRSLVLPYSTRITGLKGAVLDVTSRPGHHAALELEGDVGEYGSARAEGSVNPADPEKFTDVEAKFANVKMPPLSPYSITFAGRRIASGSLSLDLDYKIDDGELQGKNRIVTEGLRLGERVKSPQALDLPLDLAVALLTDPRGKIDIAIPIEGDIGKPEFDYERVMRAALANTVRRVVSAPFRVLAGVAGGTGAELDTVAFEPGTESLPPPARETLDQVARALKERPRLKLVVRGPYDPKADAAALREHSARRALARAVGTKLAPDEEPGPVPYDNARTQRALERLLTARAGAGAVDDLARRFEQSTGAPPERVGWRRPSADRAFYEAVFERLAELTPLPKNAPEQLASRRARRIVDYLAGAGVARTRVEAGTVRSVESGAGHEIVAHLGVEARAS